MIGDEDHRGDTVPDALAYSRELHARGYITPNRKPSGRWVAILPGIYNVHLVTDIHSLGHERTWSFEDLYDAVRAAWSDDWDGASDPPGEWIRASGPDGHRYRLPRAHD